MALSPRTESKLMKSSSERISKTANSIEKLRLRCLARGASGIRGLGRSFRIVDDDGDRKLRFDEFIKGLDNYGLIVPKEEAKQIFDAFDRDKSGTISFDEFLYSLRPPMSQRRRRLVEMAFEKMDVNGNDVITVEDLRATYSVKNHKKYLSGEWTELQCFAAFLRTFGATDNRVTKDDFMNYYSAVSSSIDDDPYFDLMIRSAYKLID